MTSDLAIRKSIPEIVKAWDQAQLDIKRGLELLQKAQAELEAAFKTSGSFLELTIMNYNDVSLDYDYKLKRMKKGAWMYMVHRAGIRTLMSRKRCVEFDNLLRDHPEQLPDITVDNLMGWISDMPAQVDLLFQESVHEVIEMLKPSTSRLKTNSTFKIGKKAILHGYVQWCQFIKKFEPGYRSEDDLRNLNNIFRLLDGQGISPLPRGELVNAIWQVRQSGGVGETDYFRFKCYRNGNLHLEFKRPDLVEKLNAYGGNALPDPNK